MPPHFSIIQRGGDFIIEACDIFFWVYRTLSSILFRAELSNLSSEHSEFRVLSNATTMTLSEFLHVRDDSSERNNNHN